MAKAEPQEVMTPERAAELENQLAVYRQQQADQAAAERREMAKPLLDLVKSDAFKAVEAALPALDEIGVKRDLFPGLITHIEALRHGLFGLRQTVEFMPGGTTAEEAAPAADGEPAAS